VRKMKADQTDQSIEPLAVRVPQAAHMLGMGKSMLYEFIASGEIEVIKVGRSTLVPVDSLRAFLTARRGRTSTKQQDERHTR